jgi:hypothetical protein
VNDLFAMIDSFMRPVTTDIPQPVELPIA